MNRLAGLTLLAVLGAFLGTASADSVSLQLELEGTLSSTRDGFKLTVADEVWTLRLDKPSVLENLLKADQAPKLLVRGTARVSTGHNIIQLRDRTIQVQDIEPLIPGYQISGLAVGSPAVGRLQKGDIILEIAGAKIRTQKILSDVVNINRGKKINLLIVREGKPKVIEDVQLREQDRPLGVDGGVIWISSREIPSPYGEPSIEEKK